MPTSRLQLVDEHMLRPRPKHANGPDTVQVREQLLIPRK